MNPQHRISDEELLNDLREFADTLDNTPSSKEMNQDGPYNSNPYKDRFGWNNALREAGLEIIRSSPSVPEDERKQQLLEALFELAEDLGRLPTQKEIREYTDYSHTMYYNYWGGIEDALRANDADLDSISMERNTRPRSIETEDILEELQRLAKELEHAPRCVDIRKHGKYSDSP